MFPKQPVIFQINAWVWLTYLESKYGVTFNLGSVPSIVAEREALAQIDGAMPRLTAIPAGCAFHPRCPHAFERCRHERPELLLAGATRAACWLVKP